MAKKNKNIKIVFMGTPEIAVPTLKILNKNFKIEAVVTVPDKPKGRGLQALPSAIKIAAQQLHLEVLQPEKLDEINFIEKIREISPDFIVVFAFRILPAAIYNLAKVAAFNVHTSLLPRHRGAAPINWTIIKGERRTGLSAFLLNDKVDSGNIVSQIYFRIPKFTTAGKLHNMFMRKAPKFTLDTCEDLLSGDEILQIQTDSGATVAPKIFKKTAKINWNSDSLTVANFINGYSPIPCAWTILNDLQLNIFHAKTIRINCETKKNATVGSFFIENKKLFVKCKSGFVEILELQLEGKKKMQTTDFINGYRGENHGEFR